tara:strand:- start:18 stop:1097 length:1080 start_codon:yes stop_codon:yes gene_type:complete
MIKVYQTYIIKSYSKIFSYVLLSFFSLIIILNIFEEISYFKDTESSLLTPFFLTFLNAPSIVYETFPFIFFISIQFFFIRLLDKEELDIFKKISLSNFKLISLLSFFSFILSIFIIFVFYNLSSNLKFMYLDIKNKYSKDNKYLAIVTENGLWIKDEVDNKINIINAEKIENEILRSVTINVFSKDYQNLENILADEINIKDKKWKIKKGNFSKNNQKMEIKENVIFESNFNSMIINNLFSDLSSLNFFELKSLKNDYRKLGYSLTNINVHYQKLFSYPFYLTIMTLFGSIVMLNIKRNKSKIFHIILGTFFSVLIYYINYFSNLLGENEKLPELLSIWLPLIIISLFCTIGLVNINEK